MCVGDKLSFRRVGKRAQKNIREETAQMEMWQMHPDVLKATSGKRLFQNKKLYFDDNEEYGGNPVTIPPDFVVYKDLVSLLFLHLYLIKLT